MFAVAARARTLLALGLLTAASAVCWGLDAFDRHLSTHADSLDRAAAITFSIITGLAVSNVRALAQREQMRKAYEADRDLYTLALKARLSPQRGGDDGAPVPRREGRPAWVRYYPSEPAA